VAPGDRRGNRAARGHRRASEPAAPAEPPGRPGIERLARAVGALVEERASGLGSGLDLSGSTTAVASGLGTTLADLARPFAGDTAATTVDSRGAAAVSDSRPASSPAALPALLDPSRPASILLFFLVLGGGAALLVYAFRRELVGGPGRRRRHRA
jgi:hypothetical protein